MKSLKSMSSNLILLPLGFHLWHIEHSNVFFYYLCEEQ